jgi:hypothetical protein
MLITTSSTEGYLQVSAVQRRSRAITMCEARSRSRQPGLAAGELLINTAAPLAS